jgi:hypothetical protein
MKKKMKMKKRGVEKAEEGGGGEGFDDSNFGFFFGWC